MASISVFCGSSSGHDGVYRVVAERLGERLARDGHRLVYGGGHVGLMGVVADAAIASGGEVHGVITSQLQGLEVAHEGLSTLDVTGSMHERKARMAELSDGVIVLPGGFGTLDEAFEILTWNQLGIVAMPVVFLDVNDYFRDLLAFVRSTVGTGFVRDDHASMAQRAGDVDEAVTLATSPASGYTPKWVDAPVEP
ncbi:MAG: TIGR00730 family Rossman fold protein [Actinomycetota bacterium]